MADKKYIVADIADPATPVAFIHKSVWLMRFAGDDLSGWPEGTFRPYVTTSFHLANQVAMNATRHLYRQCEAVEA